MSNGDLLNKSSSSEDSYSFLVFDDSRQDQRDVALAAKFWRQFELEPQIESRLVSKDNISQSSRKDSARYSVGQRVRSQPATKSAGSRTSQTEITRSQTIPALKLGNTNSRQSNLHSRHSLKTVTYSDDRQGNKSDSISHMVKQLKQTAKYVSSKGGGMAGLVGVGELEQDLDADISDHETTIESEMRQLDMFDDAIGKSTSIAPALHSF